MSDEKTKAETQTDDNAAEETPKKSGLMKYLLLGGIGLVAMVAVIVVTLMFFGGDSEAEVPADEQDGTHEVADSHETTPDESQAAAHEETADDSHEAISDYMSEEDSIMALLEQDESVLENIMANLEILDYDPGDDELGEADGGMSVEDSLEQANWIETEKAKLAEREKDLASREAELAKLDRSVSQKIMRIEQTESARIAQLAKLYDGMEPRAVAKLAANLDDATVVSILPRMKQKNASQLLQLLPAKRAANLSKQMITIAEK